MRSRANPGRIGDLRRSPGGATPPWREGVRAALVRAALVFALPLFLLAAATPLTAQKGRTALSFWGGFPFPAEDLSVYFDGGWDLGASVEYRVTDRVGIVVNGGRSRLDPQPREDLGLGHEPGPSVIQWRTTLGVLVEFTDPTNPWEISLNGGAGAITHDVKREEAAPGFFDSSYAGPIREVDVDTGPGVALQARVGRDLEEFLGIPVNFFFQSQWSFVVNDADDPSEFLGRDSLFTQGFGISYRF